MKITRERIINELGKKLVKNPSVFAFWLEGADAHNTVDEYSDIDVWFDVQDGYEKTVIKQVEAILSKISPLDFKHETNHPHPKIRQMFFHLKATPEFLIVDVCVQSHSREFWYTDGNADEKVKIIFEKGKVIEFRKPDMIEFNSLQKKRVKEIRKTFLFFQAWVKKGVNRGNFLEALKYYNEFVLDPLVELFRIRYSPTKRAFGLKHIERDLPRSVLQTLEDLYKINSNFEITTKLKAANELFFELLKKVEKKK
jgi:hypothetical protein